MMEANQEVNKRGIYVIKTTRPRVNLRAFAYTFGLGVIGAALGAQVYTSLAAPFLAAMLAFALTMGFAFMGLYISESLRPRFTQAANKSVIMCLMALALALLALVAGVLELFCGVGARTRLPLAIMVDDSGSMDFKEADPLKMRADKVVELISELPSNQQVLVGYFSDNAAVIGDGFMNASQMINMLNDDKFKNMLRNGGGTETIKALEAVFDKSGGKQFRFLLITDGQGPIGDVNNWIRKCEDTGSSISFIQINNTSDEIVELHKRLANETQGQYLPIDNFDKLQMGLDAVLKSNDSLLLPERGFSIKFICFYLLLGLFAGVSYWLAMGASRALLVQIPVSLAAAALSYALANLLAPPVAPAWIAAAMALLPYAPVIAPYRQQVVIKHSADNVKAADAE